MMQINSQIYPIRNNVIDVVPYLPEYKVVAECGSCDHICYMIIPKALSAKPMECPECGGNSLWVTRSLGRRVRKLRKASSNE